MLEPVLEPIFHEDSYGYRPGKSAHQALEKARSRCWQYDWVLDMDIKSFFDSIDHALLMKALKKHTDCKWIILYIQRWLVVPFETTSGERIERNKGVPQESIIGPVLSNLFLHYAFYEWMRRTYPHIPFERYADDAICHCTGMQETGRLKEAIQQRFDACKLELHTEKTQVVYCKRNGKEVNYGLTKFDFLGYTFQPRLAKSAKNG